MTIEQPRYEQDRLAKFADLGAATVYEANGQTGAMDAGMKPLDPNSVLVGRAVTVDLSPGDNWYVHVAILEAEPGDILVVDAKGYMEAGPWGDVLTCLAQQRGLVGLVIDGAVRDSREIVASGFPVFARGLSIKGTTKVAPGRVNVSVMVGGVAIEPGDVILGDADGLVRVSSPQVHDALIAAQARANKEAAYRDRIREGANTLDLLGLHRPT